MATSSIGPGDELRYWYSVMQAHRDLVHPATPTPKTKTIKRQAVQGKTDAEAVKRQAVTDAEAVKRQVVQGNTVADLVHPPTPTPKTKAGKFATATTNTSSAACGVGKNSTSSKRAAEISDGLDPDCLCAGSQKCKQGFCWFLGGRVLLSARRVHVSSR